MIETEFAKRDLRVRRDRRDMIAAGYELVGEGGGRLWELHRGCRTRAHIADVRVAASGNELWVKIVDDDGNIVSPGEHPISVAQQQRGCK